MYKKVIASLAALTMVLGAGALAGGNAVADSLTVQASAAGSFETVDPYKEFLESMTTADLIKYMEENNFVAKWWEDPEYEGYLVHFFFSQNDSSDIGYVQYEKLADEEYIWYADYGDEIGIIAYTGSTEVEEGSGNTKAQFTIPETIAGKKVTSINYITEALVNHTDYSYQSLGLGGNGTFITPKTVKTIYIPRYITVISAGFYWEEGSDFKLLVNDGSAAHQFAEEYGIPYEIVPDDFAFETDDTTGEETEAPADDTTGGEETEAPTDGTTGGEETTTPSDDNETENTTDNGGNNGGSDNGSKGDTNPATGAGAAAAAALAIVGAAVVVTKRRK